jgi:predicted nucleic acid-binding protein
MHKPRIYIDTSVIGGCFDEEFAEWSNKLFDEFIAGKKIAVVSQVTFDELKNAPSEVKSKINEIPLEYIQNIEINPEIMYIAKMYIKMKSISDRCLDDATHIACATYSNVDYLVSWNFKHIVNVYRIQKYNAVNLMHGYKTIDIRTPREVISDE